MEREQARRAKQNVETKIGFYPAEDVNIVMRDIHIKNLLHNPFWFPNPGLE